MALLDHVYHDSSLLSIPFSLHPEKDVLVQAVLVREKQRLLAHFSVCLIEVPLLLRAKRSNTWGTGRVALPPALLTALNMDVKILTWLLQPQTAKS